jgi:tetratricopeptide (TPR) repeat protein
LATAVVFQVSAAGAFQYVYPFQTLALAPRNAIANANMAARLQVAGRQSEARILAYAALERDPTSVVALRTLGLADEADGNLARAAQMIGLAQALSRRDLPTQLWQITHAIRRGDFEAAVGHFDIAMRTSTAGENQLIPILVAATGDQRVLPPLARLLDRNPSWKLAFLNQLAALGPRPDHVVRLTLGRLDPAVPEEKEAIRSLIDRLAGTEQFNLAWALYHSVNRGDDPAVLRDGDFESPETYPPFDWSFADDPDLSALRTPPPNGAPGNVLSLIVRNNRTGSVARQLVRLAPGTYQLEFEIGNVPAAAADRPVINLACSGRPDPVLAVRPERAGDSPQRIGRSFTIPANCPWQWLAINISGGGSDVSSNPWIDNLSIRAQRTAG